MDRATGGLQEELAEMPEGVDTQATDRYQRPWQVKHSEILLFDSDRHESRTNAAATCRGPERWGQ
jgi:hypothetical protein